MNHCYDYWSSEANPQRPTFNRSDKRVLDELDIVPRQLASVPHCALFLSFQFTLETAYLSKNDRMAISKDGHQLLIHDNPIKMEWAFRVPMVSATTWKGNLRAATRILVADPQNEEQWKPRLEMLLGTETEKGDKDNRLLEKGRLNFFPSYFAKVEKDILNPRNRKTRTGTTPIRLEQVPPCRLRASPFFTLHSTCCGWTRPHLLASESWILLSWARRWPACSWSLVSARRRRWGSARPGRIWRMSSCRMTTVARTSAQSP